MKRTPAKERQILVCIKRPGEGPMVEPLFDNTLEAFQRAVGGYIGTVTLCTDLVLIVNEEGRLRGLPYNLDIWGCPFYGTVIAAGVKGDEFASIKGSSVSWVLRLLTAEETTQN